MEWEEVDDLKAVAADVDVLYQTRIQKVAASLVFQARHFPVILLQTCCADDSFVRCRSAFWTGWKTTRRREGNTSSTASS